MTILQANEVSKTHNKVTVLHNVSFSVQQGDCIVIIGKDGVGKTTLLHCCAGLTGLTSGKIEINPHVRTGYLIGHHGLFPSMSGLYHLRRVAAAKGLMRSDIDEVVQMFNLTYINQIVKEYSLSQIKMLKTALAFLGRPDIILIDDLRKDLEAYDFSLLLQAIRFYRKQYNTAFVFTSYNLNDIQNLANRVIVLKEGHILKELTQMELDTFSQEKVELSVDNPALALAVLEQELGLYDIEVQSDYKLVINCTIEFNPKIIAAMVRHKIKVNEMKSSRFELQDYLGI